MTFPARCIFSGLLLATTALWAEPIVDFGIAAEGRIVPGDGLVAVAAPGIVAEVKVKAGDTVKKGDVLAVLEGAEVAQAAVQVAEARVKVAQAGVKVAKTRQAAADFSTKATEAQKTVLEAQIAEAESGVAVAQKAMARALAEHDAAAANLNGQIAEYRRIITDLDPPRKDREDLTSRQNMLQLQIAKLSETRQPLEAELQAQVAQAQAGVAAAKAQLTVTDAQTLAAQAEAGVAMAQADYTAARELAVAEAALAQAQAEAKAMQVLAPMDGTVIVVNVQPGEAVGPNGVCFLGDTTHMFVEAQVYIDDIKRVKAGQKATVSGTALGGDLKGTVAEVGLMVSPANLYTPDPTVFTDRRVVPVRIALNDSAKAAKLIYAQVTVKISNGGE